MSGTGAPDGFRSGAGGSHEEELLGRVIDTLLREDAYRLRGRARTVRRADGGDWLRIALDGGECVLLPVEEDGFQCEIRARRPVRLEFVPPPGAAGGNGDIPGDTSAATVVTGLDAVLRQLRRLVPAEDRAGYDSFMDECRQALDTARLHDRIRPGIVAHLTTHYGPEPGTPGAGVPGVVESGSGRPGSGAPGPGGSGPGGPGAVESGRGAPRPGGLARGGATCPPGMGTAWAGMAGSLAYDTLAAFRDHPVYPTGRARSGVDEAALHAYAPEFHPTFPLRWVALPREAVAGEAARLPPWWPAPGELGLERGLDRTHLAVPVHPLTVGRPLVDALGETGLGGSARLAGRAYLDVVPTLSMRTVAVADDPLVHLKLPLTTATLGLRNRRTVKPGTLIDGAVAQRLVAAVIAREPRFTDTVLLADETTHLHAGHALLATLVRRYPPGLEHTRIVPLAGLLARTPDGGTVVDALADRYYGGDLRALLDAYYRLLFDFHTTLFAHGIALESHQQNTSLVFEDGATGPRLRLLIKDHDGPRVHAVRLAAMIGGGAAADLCGFDDRRILARGDVPVTDVFTTITVHLCAAAPAFELAALGRAPLDDLLRQLRTRLTEAVDRMAGTRPGATADLLRARLLDAPRLPVKAMVTAGTLLPKERTGAADINKHYVTGPNYLLRGSGG
ncbi:IucA/IucC family protein [Streptomyces sp. NPDC048636]|uniref:IucA/IucC family protein n=1 Tax=Streptomyces sp. NPDC048636 TaxID=3155762 RepID=UPI00343C5024